MESFHILKLMIEGFILGIKSVPLKYYAYFFLMLVFVASLRRIKIPRRRKTWEETRKYSAPETILTREERLGQAGEDRIAEILYRTVPGEFQIFRNVYVPYRGKMTEIDLLMVHKTGLFVFESKNYGGCIYGSIEDSLWTQALPDRKIPFYNPVWQNHNHIKALSQYLQIPENCFYSYIVFSDRCLLRKVPANTRFRVITRSLELEEDLKRMISALPSPYGAKEARRIANRLIPLTHADDSVKEKHIEDIRAALESDICPFCGGKLVTRRGEYGEFLGCSNYPQCKFKRTIA